MGSKHRKPERENPNHTHGGRAATGRPRTNVLIGTVSASIASAGILAGAIVHLAGSNSPQAPQTASPQQSPSRSLSQEGTLIAVSGDSVTARSANGFTQTYLITPDTAAITAQGGQTASAAAEFTVNDQVSIVGTVQDGTAVANAVADRDVAHLDGPPMDSVAAQPVSHAGEATVVAP
jgi:hypothetical protein